MSFLKNLFKKKKSRYLRDNPKLAKFEIGAWSYGWPSIRFDECGGILKIGNYCSIAKKTVIMLGGEHSIYSGTSYPFHQVFPECHNEAGEPMVGMTKGNVEIGSDVWICHGAYIGSGIKVGHGAVIAAMAVVTKDIEPFSIVGGNPAKHIRYRFDKEIRERLLELAWWDWPHEKIIKAWPYLKDFDIDKLEGMTNAV